MSRSREEVHSEQDDYDTKRGYSMESLMHREGIWRLHHLIFHYNDYKILPSICFAFTNTSMDTKQLNDILKWIPRSNSYSILNQLLKYVAEEYHLAYQYFNITVDKCNKICLNTWSNKRIFSRWDLSSYFGYVRDL